jgi:hypothetical protein
MENKQTAVDWLFLMLNDPNRDQEFAKKLYDKAKEIEKEQIVQAHIHGDENHTFNSSKIEEYANDYYNETYEK